jgi:hypothetical protein
MGPRIISFVEKLILAFSFKDGVLGHLAKLAAIVQQPVGVIVVFVPDVSQIVAISNFTYVADYADQLVLVLRFVVFLGTILIELDEIRM